jgi:hypothetical protein
MEFHYLIALIFLAIVAVFFVYVVAKSIQQQRVLNVESVTTGEVVYHTEHDSNPVVVEKVILFGKKFVAKGQTHNSSDYIRVRAEGNSMKLRDINNGDIIFARKFDDTFTHSHIRPNDILLLHLNDARYNGYKIRVCSEISPKIGLKTFYYNPDGSTHNSSQPHSLDRAVGIVQYKIESI